MATSNQFKILRKHINKLRKQLLPRAFDPIGSYSDRTQTLAIAFRLLAHAEFETYFETRVTEIAKHAMQEWLFKDKPSKVVIALIAFSKNRLPNIPDSMAGISETKKDQIIKISLIERTKTALTSFLNVVKDNNGIKEKNILNLLLPIGYSYDNIDTLWISNMNSFGSMRGESAHNSMVNYLLDPQDELQKVNDLIEGIKSIDQSLKVIT